MITSKILYEMIQPITSYEIIIGGALLPVNFKKGSVLITHINNSVLSNSNKNFTKLIDVNDDSFIEQYSIIQSNYQLDVYKINDNKQGIIEANQEALNIQEYLKSLDVQEYLKANNIEILPSYSNITCLSEFNEQKHLINRAFFEFSLISYISIKQKVNKIDKIQNNNIILGG